MLNFTLEERIKPDEEILELLSKTQYKVVNGAYNIGIAFQEEMWPFTYTIIMITHSNKDNIHNHMLVIPDERSRFNEKSFYKRREEVTKMVWKKIKDNK
ncbi:MAG: hypothetical protein IKO78_06380 [Bacilli bacterium]|nr:hypothetical protein [Bacilli bacterium]